MRSITALITGIALYMLLVAAGQALTGEAHAPDGATKLAAMEQVCQPGAVVER